MASDFDRAARIQIIFTMWLFAAPIFAALVFAIARGLNETTPYFWIGLSFMIASYGIWVLTMWNQIQAHAHSRA